VSSEKIGQKIERHCASHGAPIKVTKCESLGNGERYIYTIKLKAGTRESLIFDRARDIQIALRLPLFQPFKEGINSHRCFRTASSGE
jgi:hypothetical protein